MATSTTENATNKLQFGYMMVGIVDNSQYHPSREIYTAAASTPYLISHGSRICTSFCESDTEE